MIYEAMGEKAAAQSALNLAAAVCSPDPHRANADIDCGNLAMRFGKAEHSLAAWGASAKKNLRNWLLLRNDASLATAPR